jgi:hypothetical protein
VTPSENYRSYYCDLFSVRSIPGNDFLPIPLTVYANWAFCGASALLILNKDVSFLVAGRCDVETRFWAGVRCRLTD